MENTLIIFKPDSIERGLVGVIFSEFIARNGFSVIKIEAKIVTRDIILAHYKENLIGKDDEIKERVVKFYENKLVIVLVLQRDNAIAKMREILGNSDPIKSNPNTIRGKYGNDSYYLADQEKRSCRNLIHASDSSESFQYEHSVWFQ